MPVSKSVKSKQAPEAAARSKTSIASAAAPSKTAAVKPSAAPAAKAKKDSNVVTKSQAELKAMADALLAEATPKRGRKKAAEEGDEQGLLLKIGHDGAQGQQQADTAGDLPAVGRGRRGRRAGILFGGLRGFLLFGCSSHADFLSCKRTGVT